MNLVWSSSLACSVSTEHKLCTLISVTWSRIELAQPKTTRQRGHAQCEQVLCSMTRSGRGNDRGLSTLLEPAVTEQEALAKAS